MKSLIFVNLLLLLYLLLTPVSCGCSKSSDSEGDKTENLEGNTAEQLPEKPVPKPTPFPAQLLLSSNKSTLRGKNPSFKIIVENDQETVANLSEYILQITLQEDGNVGSTLQYTNVNTTYNIPFVKQPLTHFVKPETLKKGDVPLHIPFHLHTLPGVIKLTLTATLEHRGKKR